MWKNTVESGRPIRRLRTACRITKATDTHSDYQIIIVFPRQQWLRELALLLRYTYIAYLVPVKYIAVHPNLTKIRIRIPPITNLPWSLSIQDTGLPAGKISVHSLYFMLSFTVEWASNVFSGAVTTKDGRSALYEAYCPGGITKHGSVWSRTRRHIRRYVTLLTFTNRSGAGRFVLATFRAPYELYYTVCLLRLSLRVGRGYDAGCGTTEPRDALFLSANSHSRGDVRLSVDVEPTVCWCPGTTGRMVGAMGVWLGICVYDVYRLLFLQNIGILKRGQALRFHYGGTSFESLSWSAFSFVCDSASRSTSAKTVKLLTRSWTMTLNRPLPCSCVSFPVHYLLSSSHAALHCGHLECR